MLIKKISVAFLSLLFLALQQSCDPQPQKPLDSPALYDLNNPVEVTLPDVLREISGITYYPKDSSVFAIIDEDGLFYKIYLDGSNVIKKWRFDKNYDFEDVVLNNNLFYVLVSNGDVKTLRFSGDSVYTAKSDLAGASKKLNEFESLYYDDSLGLVLLCKDCERQQKENS